MKTLLLMRHAKSSWKSDAQNDHDRPLNKRGYQDSPKILKYLQQENLLPEMVISSTATRTRETWKHMQQAISNIVPIQYSKSLYHGALTDIQNQVVLLGSGYNRIMVLGHNPGWENAVKTLCDTSIEMTTANVVILTIEEETWRSAFSQTGEWNLVDHIQPRKL
jgi:phosphohistidine phosphatase